jgi:hypothetical protein
MLTLPHVIVKQTINKHSTFHEMVAAMIVYDIDAEVQREGCGAIGGSVNGDEEYQEGTIQFPSLHLLMPPAQSDR